MLMVTAMSTKKRRGEGRRGIWEGHHMFLQGEGRRDQPAEFEGGTIGN